MGAFLPCKIVCHVAITWNFPLYPFSSYRCTKRHYRSSDTLYNCNDYFATHSGWLGYSRKKTKWELVIRDKNFLDLNTGCHCRHSFCFALSRIHKKDISECLRAKLWKFDYSPSEKPLLKILAARWFLLSWAFAFKKTRAKRVHSCFWGFRGACPLNKITEWEFITVVKKYPLCMLAYFFLNLWFLSLRLQKLPLD